MRAQYKRMLFDLPQDEDGYPPISVEGIWVEPIGSGNFRIENVPFYVRELSCDDVVSGRLDDSGNLNIYFDSLVSPSGNSTFRVIVHDIDRLEEVRLGIVAYGVSTEVDRRQRLIAIDIPSTVHIEPLLNYLMSLRDEGIADFEEGALRHPLNGNLMMEYTPSSGDLKQFAYHNKKQVAMRHVVDPALNLGQAGNARSRFASVIPRKPDTPEAMLLAELLMPRPLLTAVLLAN